MLVHTIASDVRHDDGNDHKEELNRCHHQKAEMWPSFRLSIPSRRSCDGKRLVALMFFVSLYKVLAQPDTMVYGNVLSILSIPPVLQPVSAALSPTSSN